ncbi:MAG: hypothetical protein ACYSWX_13710 [Planctomycetota bacterium]|jgi:hypothetical protein
MSSVLARVLLLLSAAALTSNPGLALQSQSPNVIHVDDDGGQGIDFTSIAAAVEAAGESELVIVHEGTYGSFLVSNKSVRVVAAGDGPVVVAGNARIQFLNGAQQVVLRGLIGPTDGDAFTITLFQNFGRILVEDCVVGPRAGSSSSFPALSSSGDTSVGLVRSRFRGGSLLPQIGAGGGHGQPGVDAVASNLWCYDSTFIGGPGIGPGSPGGAGMRYSNFELFIAGCVFRGGDGAPGTCDVDAGAGGNGLDQLGFVTNVHARANRFAGGEGGAAGCASSPSGVGRFIGEGANTYTVVGSENRTFASSEPVGPGEPLVVSFDAPATDEIVLFANTLQGVAQLYGAGGVGLLQFPANQIWRGPAGASGQWSLPSATQLLPPGWESLTLYLQPLFLSVNGAAILGPASAAVILESPLGG